MTITIDDDFSIQKIADSGQCFRVKELENGIYRFITGNHILYIKQSDSCEKDYEISCDSEEWNNIFVPYFDLSRNYRKIRQRIPKDDTYMLEAANCGKGIRILRQDPFEMLLSFIISQQKKIPEIKKAVEMLSYKYGHRITTDYEEVFTFPSISDISGICEADLAEVKLGYRSSYIIDAIERVFEGSLVLENLYSLSDDELYNALISVKGVGAKVANCICLFAYGRTGRVPVDTWIRKTIEAKYNGINPYPKYKEAAGIMQQYTFYYAKQHPEEFSY